MDYSHIANSTLKAVAYLLPDELVRRLDVLTRKQDAARDLAQAATDNLDVANFNPQICEVEHRMAAYQEITAQTNLLWDEANAIIEAQTKTLS